MNMTHPDILETEKYGRPEAEVVGDCGVCDERIFDYDDYKTCEGCERIVHRKCMNNDFCQECERN